MRARTVSSKASSGSGGMSLSQTARIYPSDCNNPGTSRHSYVQRLTATLSSRAHRLNHAAGPGARFSPLRRHIHHLGVVGRHLRPTSTPAVQVRARA